MPDNRPSKKQRELLSFIDGFIKGNGYGPSYREIMRALNYKSVSTVAVHVDGLITRGFLRKRDHSARSLEVVSTEVTSKASSTTAVYLDWLRSEIDRRTPDSPEADILRQALMIIAGRERPSTSSD